MTAQSSRAVRHGARTAAALVLCLALGACGRAGSTTSPSPSPTSDPSPRGTNGPTTWAAWVERQGFGGGSGLREIVKGSAWLHENGSRAAAYDVTFWGQLATSLGRWLDTHPATECWADYHAAIRSVLSRMEPEFASLQQIADASRPLPAEATAALASLGADAAAALAPEDCP